MKITFGILLWKIIIFLSDLIFLYFLVKNIKKIFQFNKVCLRKIIITIALKFRSSFWGQEEVRAREIRNPNFNFLFKFTSKFSKQRQKKTLSEISKMKTNKQKTLKINNQKKKKKRTFSLIVVTQQVLH